MEEVDLKGCNGETDVDILVAAFLSCPIPGGANDIRYKTGISANVNKSETEHNGGKNGTKIHLAKARALTAWRLKDIFF